MALILGYTQLILQRFYCKISFGKIVSIQEKGIPEFANTLELMFFSVSKSAVERTSSLLTTLLNDRRISMAYDTMEGCLLIAGNNQLVRAREVGNV